MKILIACEYSGTVRDAFLAKGHDAMSCDLLPTESPGPHYQGDVFDIINDGWDMILAFPPCTYLSNAGAARLYPKKGELNKDRYEKGLKGKEFFMTFYNHKCPKIAIENPVPTRVFKMPDYSQVLQPHDFGHPFKKKTCLWLKGLPPLMATDLIMDNNLISWVSGGSKNHFGQPRKNKGTAIRSAKERAKFWPGIAKAMAEQWG